MEALTKIAWVLLALVHALPAAVLFVPALTQRLYSVEPAGEPGILIVHRGALFLAVVVAACYAAFEPGARRVASLVVGLSVVGFLFVYWRAGWPAGSLRTIAVVDLIALIPLVFVLYRAWRA